MLRLIVDFDGPIVDISERYYHVYQLCLAEAKRPDRSVCVLSKREFWQLKRSRVPEAEIGRISGLDEEQVVTFVKKRGQMAHALSFLSYDQLIPGAVAALERVQQAGIDLVVLTMRRERELQEAFDRLDLARFFPAERCYCITNDYIKNGDTHDKPLLMAKALATLPPASESWMVGDKEADIVAAKTHQMKSIAVLSGIRDRVQLESYQPDLIVNNLSEAVDIILASPLQTLGKI